ECVRSASCTFLSLQAPRRLRQGSGVADTPASTGALHRDWRFDQRVRFLCRQKFRKHGQQAFYHLESFYFLGGRPIAVTLVVSGKMYNVYYTRGLLKK